MNVYYFLLDFTQLSTSQLSTSSIENSKCEIDSDCDPARNFKNAYNLLCSGFGPYQPTNCNFPQVKGRQFRK